MQPVEVAIAVPQDLPQYTGQPQIPWNRLKLEKSLNDLGNRGLWPAGRDDSDQLMLLFRVVMTYGNWKQTHRQFTEKMFAAVSKALFDPSFAEKRNELEKLVNATIKDVGSFLPHDTNFKIGDRTICESKLAFTARSAYFNTLFGASHFKKEEVEVKEVSLPIFEAYAHLIEYGVPPSGFKPTPQQFTELLLFANRMGSEPAIFPFLEEWSDGKTIDPDVARLVYGYVDTTPNLKKACFKGLLDNISSPSDLQELCLIIKKYEQPSHQESYLDEIDRSVEIESKDAKEWLQVANQLHLPKLKKQCIRAILGGLNFENAYALRKTPPQIEFCTPDEIKAVCEEWLLEQVSQWCMTLEHRWNPEKNEMEGGILKNVFKSPTKNQKEALRQLKLLSKQIGSFTHVPRAALINLDEREMKWLFNSVSPQLEELDFTKLKINNLAFLARFIHLRKLILKGCNPAHALPPLPALELLDIRDSEIVQDFEQFPPFPHLKTLLIRVKGPVLNLVRDLKKYPTLLTVDLRGSSNEIQRQKYGIKHAEVLTDYV